jgi:hypothetical protein
MQDYIQKIVSLISISSVFERPRLFNIHQKRWLAEEISRDGWVSREMSAEKDMCGQEREDT